MISKQLEDTLRAAVQEARKRRHEYLCAEHVLFALLDDPVGRDILENVGVDIERLRKDLDEFLSKQLDQVPEGQRLVVQQTVAFDRIMKRALAQVRFSSKGEVEAGDTLAALLEEPQSHAAFFLEEQGVTRLDVLNYVSHGVSKDGDVDEEDEDAPDEARGEDAEQAKGKRDPLELYTDNLAQLAAQGKIDPLIGRETELARAIRVLCRRRKNNPVFVGEPGVGKTAIVEGLALRIHDGRVPDLLKGAEIFRLDLGALLAGTQFRGDLEGRIKAVIKALLKRPKVILFIDEIHMVVGAGSTRGSDVDVSGLLKPLLAAGELRCIGATTFEEYKNGVEKDRALARRFQKIDVVEPTVEETYQILRGLKSRYEAHHGITYTDSALHAAAELAAKYVNDRFLPDKAIDVLDEAGAQVRIESRDQRKTIRPSDVERIVAEMARIPAKSVSSADKERLGQLEDDLKRVVYGQDEAVHAIATAIKRSRAGLSLPDKPVGSFLFTGPTGVGKTELAKQLATTLGIDFIRFDMSEYMEEYTISKLIGSSRGYVGFDLGGELTEQVRKHPHSVLLLDEIEKAHPKIFNVLLQIMDYGTLTDNAGRKADLRNIILVMTSNAGAREIEQRTLGFRTDPTDTAGKSQKALQRLFTPEFRNRLDAIVTFGALPREVVLRIVHKFIAQLGERLGDRKVTIEVTPAAAEWLADQGYDPKLGARPLGRLIQRELEEPLADEVLFGKLAKGGRVTVDLADVKLAFAFSG
jgi:ATP-dependent Clp protease ATP-binding subunit ClpA